MKLVTTLLLGATCSAFALDDGPIFACDREMVRGLHGDLAKPRSGLWCRPTSTLKTRR